MKALISDNRIVDTRSKEYKVWLKESQLKCNLSDLEYDLNRVRELCQLSDDYQARAFHMLRNLVNELEVQS